MKLVTFNRAMAPHGAGEQRLLPDDVASRLEEAGAIAPNPPSWPPGPETAAPPRKPRILRAGRDLLGQTYLTK